MKRYIKYFLLFFMIINFDNIVYAEELTAHTAQCFQLPGENNIVVPIDNGMEISCYYEFDKIKSNVNVVDNETYSLVIEKNGGELRRNDITKIINFSAQCNNNLKDCNLHDYREAIIESEINNSFGGFPYSVSTEKIKTYFDNVKDGCPKSIFWVHDNLEQEKLKLYFSGSKNPTISTKSSDAKYAVFTIYDSTDDENPDNETVINYERETYFYPAFKDDLKEKASICNNSNTFVPTVNFRNPNETLEPDENNPNPNYHSKEQIISCQYYFDITQSPTKNDGKKCSTYVKTTLFRENNGGIISFSYEFDDEIDILKRDAYGRIDKEATPLKTQIDRLNYEISQNNYEEDYYSLINEYFTYDNSSGNGYWKCPEKIYISADKPVSNAQVDTGGKIIGSSLVNWELSEGKDIYTGTKNANNTYCSAVIHPPDNGNNNGNIDFGDPIEVICTGILGQEMIDFLNKIFRWIQILAPIFVIIISVVDFAGALLQDDKDALKKASNKLIKRLIIAVALFFVPLILSWLLSVLEQVTGKASDICGVGR